MSKSLIPTKKAQIDSAKAAGVNPEGLKVIKRILDCYSLEYQKQFLSLYIPYFQDPNLLIKFWDLMVSVKIAWSLCDEESEDFYLKERKKAINSLLINNEINLRMDNDLVIYEKPSEFIRIKGQKVAVFGEVNFCIDSNFVPIKMYRYDL